MYASKEDLSQLRQKFANDLNLLQSKFDKVVNVVKICNESFTSYKERTVALEERIENGKIPSSKDEENCKIEEEIVKLRLQSEENWEEMREIQARIQLLNQEQEECL